MNINKYDGVIEAVHYNKDGQVEWVRAYERRGPAFSDIVILDRKALISQLKDGKIYFSGRRIVYMGSSFEVSNQVFLREANGKEVLMSGDLNSKRDFLEGVPVI